jgi:hypothetical protein
MRTIAPIAVSDVSVADTSWTLEDANGAPVATGPVT